MLRSIRRQRRHFALITRFSLSEAILLVVLSSRRLFNEREGAFSIRRHKNTNRRYTWVADERSEEATPHSLIVASCPMVGISAFATTQNRF